MDTQFTIDQKEELMRYLHFIEAKWTDGLDGLEASPNVTPEMREMIGREYPDYARIRKRVDELDAMNDDSPAIKPIRRLKFSDLIPLISMSIFGTIRDMLRGQWPYNETYTRNNRLFGWTLFLTIIFVVYLVVR